MKSLKINALANMLLKILNIVFPLITTPYITRLLNENDFADFNSANTYINLFVPLAAFGIYNYGVREISNKKSDPNNINYIFSKLFYTGLITALLTFIIYIFIIENKYISNYSLYYILGFQILFQFLYVEWVNEALENYSFILYKTLITRIIMLASIFIFVKEENDIVPYSIIMTLFTVFNFIASFIWIRRDISFVQVSIKDIFKTVKILIPVFLLANVNMLYTVLDRLFLTYSRNKIDISYYTLAQTILTILTGVIYGAISVNIPRLSYYLGIKDKKSYNELLNTGSKYFMFFIIPMCFGLIVLGKYTMLIAFGEKYIYGGILVTIFAIRTIFWALEVILGQQIIFTGGFEKNLTLFYFIGGIINLSLNSYLFITNNIKPEYILITTIIAELTVIILEILFIFKNNVVNIKYILLTFLKYISISSGFIPIYMIIVQFIDINLKINFSLIINIIMLITMCSAYYILALITIKDKIVLNIVNIITKRIYK